MERNRHTIRKAISRVANTTTEQTWAGPISSRSFAHSQKTTYIHTYIQCQTYTHTKARHRRMQMRYHGYKLHGIN